MLDLFNMGGPFMGILTIIFLIILATSVYRGVQISKGDIVHETIFRYQLACIKSIGVFALVVGILGQLLGLYDAFSVIEQMGDVTPALLAGGLKVSMITTLYGILIFLVSYLIWFALDYMAKSKESSVS